MTMLIVDYLISLNQAVTVMKTLATATGLLVLALGMMSPVQAQIYTWKDASGRVHFSDKAPTNQQAESIQMPVAEPAAAAPDESEQERLARQRRLVQALEEERLEKERQKAEAQAAAAEKAIWCERFRNRLARLEDAGRVYSENEDGTVTYWKDADVDRLKQERKAQYAQECIER